MKRRIINFLVVASALLCAASVVVWVRSRSSEDLIYPKIADHLVVIDSANGELFMGGSTGWPDIGARDTGWSVQPSEHADLASREHLHAMGFGRSTFNFGTWGFREGVVPDWFPMLLFAAGPVWWVVRARRRRGKGVAGFEVRPGADAPGKPGG